MINIFFLDEIETRKITKLYPIKKNERCKKKRNFYDDMMRMDKLINSSFSLFF